MKKKIHILIPALFLLYLLYPTQTHAIGPDWTNCVEGAKQVATLNCIPIIFNNIVNWALILSGTTALFLIVYSGLRYVRSGGDQEKIKGARETLMYAVIGLIIIFTSFAIINLISYVTKADCIKKFGFDSCKQSTAP